MKDFSTLDLVAAHPWSHALFTTYSLSLSFFEAVVLDVLVRQRTGKTLIMSDVDGIRASISEYGARSAGRLYEVEPVAVDTGCFHPKLVVLTSQTEAHVVVGSGNLTFGGWGSNLESVEHIHPGFAADAIDDVAGFLDALAKSTRLKLLCGDTCSLFAKQLRNFANAGARPGRLRVIHNLERSLIDQLEEFVALLGGAQRLVIVSPYYDASAADLIRKRLGIDKVLLHVHEGGTVRGDTGLSWPPASSKSFVPVSAEWAIEKQSRPLHAKVFEILCGKGRIVLSGSANATLAAWNARRNVELCVVRMYESTAGCWNFAPAVAPVLSQLTIDPDSDTHVSEGVLRATLKSGRLEGAVITRFPAGTTDVFRATAAGQVRIGATTVDSTGRFEFRAGDLENQAWTNERFLLRLVADSGAKASGYVMFADLNEIRTRVGSASGSFFAFLSGTETPSDVAAIMDWLYEHPSALHPDSPVGGDTDRGDSLDRDTTVEVATLLDPTKLRSTVLRFGNHGGSSAWQHFIAQLVQCFTDDRGPIRDDREQAARNGRSADQDESTDETPLSEETKKKPLTAFNRLFNAMLSAPQSKVDVGLALRITQYVCDRLKPELPVVSEYLRKLIEGFKQHPPKPENQNLAAGAVLVWATLLNDQPDASRARFTRGVLLGLGIALSSRKPDMNEVSGLVRLLQIDADFDALWTHVCEVRTPQEEVRAFRLDERDPLPEIDYPQLNTMPEWDLLKQARPADKRLDRLDRVSRVHIMSRFTEVCPFCRTSLSASGSTRLKETGISSHCGRVLLCEET